MRGVLSLSRHGPLMTHLVLPVVTEAPVHAYFLAEYACAQNGAGERC